MPGITFEGPLAALMESGAVPGVAVAAVRASGIEWHASVGVRSVETQEPIDRATVFEAASLSKPLVAYAALQLADAGQLEMDRPLADYLTPNVVAPSDLRPVTLRHVLSHTSGLPNWRSPEYPLRTYFPPGTRFSYSGEGFVYLQAALKAIAGQSLEELITRLVFEPLSMANSSYMWQERFSRDHVTCYDVEMRALDKFKPTSANAAYSLHTTAEVVSPVMV